MKKIVIIICLVPATAIGNVLNFLPFGAWFGQIYNSSEHNTIQRRGNIRSVLLKTTNRPDDTEKLSAEICDDFGLQILTWRSHIRSLASAKTSHSDILQNLSKKYGKPEIYNKSAFWILKEIQIVVKIRGKNKIHQNQIRYFGPKYDACFKNFKKYKNNSAQPANTDG